MMKVDMSQKQAAQFAAEIFADIDAYIQKHQEEFEQFLLEEENEGRHK